MLDLEQNNSDFKHVGDSIQLNSYYDIDFNFEKTELIGTDALDQAIENLLMTEYGERLFNFGFGSPLQKLFFENNSQADNLKEDVYEAIESMIPVRINRSNADIGKINDDNPHILYVSFDYNTTDGLVYGHHFNRKFKL